MCALSQVNIDAVYTVDWIAFMVQPSLRTAHRNAHSPKSSPRSKDNIAASKIRYVYINELMLQQKSTLPSQQTLNLAKYLLPPRCQFTAL